MRFKYVFSLVAQRVAKVVSLERVVVWHAKLKGVIESEDTAILELHLIRDYIPLLSDSLSQADLVVIDAYNRDRRAETVVVLARNPLWVYFDNFDFAVSPAEIKKVETALLGLGSRIIHKQYFTGVPPSLVAATQALLLHIIP